MNKIFYSDYFFKFVYDELRKLNEPIEKELEEYLANKCGRESG